VFQSAGTVNVTGNNASNTTSASFFMGHWSGGASATYSLSGGVLNSPNAPLSLGWDATSRMIQTGGTANLNYLDENGQPNLIENAPLPWSFTIVTTLPSMSANILVQGDRQVRDLGCRVTVDGVVRDDRTSDDTIKPFIYCLVKSV